ncbi:MULTISPECIES: autotransporter domain-containing protein [Roseomonadaceae]|uniref:Autotransporter domain-containing protein n=1 Tax=Falsiroseomonas oleicola TaxID=2801474 RepID=A0ABS6H1T4_9PROT|nr:autotransporter domain-containing protein [Roseomonas oleicola]MBU8542619.1 autotransporter domain-containing protein [Roseomonas oleicola]
MFLPSVAMAACNVTGGDLYTGGFLTCDTTGADLRLLGGSPVIEVTDHVITSGFLNVSTRPTQNSPLDITLTISNTSINSPDYSAVTVYSGFADTDIDITLDQVTLVSGDNPGGVWVRNEIGGNIVLTASGVITASGSDSPAITATTNDGGVRITNSATITSNGGRGIYADGGYNSTDPVVVSVSNSGTIQAHAAGIRVIGYNGLASIDNSGDVTSTTLQGLIAWTPNGTVEIVNSGNVTADAHIGVQGAAGSGNISITNTSTGRIQGQRGVVAATDSGTVSIDNAGTITATGHAIETGNTNATVTNSGTIETTTPGGTAIAFGTGDNTLVIMPGSTITGLVTNGSVSGGVETIGVNTLTLGGTGSASFDVSEIGRTPTQRGLVLSGGVHTGSGTPDGGQYQGFSNFTKTGSGTWQLTYGSGAGLADQNWVISEGTLVGDTTTLRGSTITNNASLVFDQASNGTFAGSIGGTGNLYVNGAGTLTMTGASAYTGNTYLRDGGFTIANGGSVGSQHSVIGWMTGDDATATVTGAGSQWTNTGNLYVGNEGNGTLNITDGGVVTSASGYVGTVSGSQGTLAIDGTNSAWRMTGAFIAGYESGTNANVTISNGGQLRSVIGTLGDLAGSEGTLTVTGAGSSWEAYNDSTDYAGFMNVGRLGTGTLTVADGGAVTAYRLYIGTEAGSTGTVAVSGQDSSIATEHRLYVGTYGTGTLTVSEGANVTADRINVAYLSGSTGTLNIGAAEGDLAVAPGSIVTNDIFLGAGNGRLVFNHTDSAGFELAPNISGGGQIRQIQGNTVLSGDNSGFAGDITITGGGLGITGTTNANALTMTGAQDAQLTVNGVLTTSSASIEAAANHASTVQVSGDGASWVSGSVQLGRNADSTGSVTISDRASFETQNGFYIGAGGTFTVSGQGSSAFIGSANRGLAADWNSSDGWLSADGGTISVSGGAHLRVDGGYIGADTTALATMNVSGAGTTFANDLNLYIGGTGNGTSGRGQLSVTDGAIVTSYTAAIGVDANSVGAVLLSGEGTGFTVDTRSGYAGNLRVGFNGNGTLVARDGASVSAANMIQIASNAGSTGVFAIGALEGEAAAAAAGSIHAGTNGIVFGAGNGRLVINHTGTNYTLGANITAPVNTAGQINVLSGNTTLSGDISGAVTLNKAGLGTLILIGTNTYTGGTYINEGTLQIGNGGTTGSLIGTIHNNANLVFNRSDNYLFPGTITGNGAVSFAGGGTVFFEQADAYSGPVTVGATSFVLANGSTSGSTYTIGAEGTISGSGTIAGLMVNSGGRAAPGYSPGTLSVAGNVTFNAGSTYEAEVWGDGTHDRIAATGTATINGGTVAVVAQSGYMRHLARYEILTADGGVSGAFDAATSNLAYLTPVLGYEADAVVLTLARNDIAFRDYATTRNQTAAADAIQALGLGNSVYESVLDLTTGSVPAALDALSGELHAAMPGMLSQQSRFLREAVSARLRDDRLALAGTQSALDGRATAWIQGFGDWSHLGGNGNAGSVTSNVGGVFIGIDQRLDENWKAGVVLGVSRTGFHANTRNSSGNADNMELGTYLGGQFGALNLQLGASYAWHDVDTKRHIVFPNANSTARAGYGANTAQVFGEASFRIDLDPVRLTPYLGLAYVNTGGESFTETGSNAALSGRIGSLDTAYSTLGLRSEAEVTLGGRTFRPQANIGWQHAIGDVAGTARLAFDNGGAGFQVGGVPIARDAAIIGAGLSYDMAPGLSLNLSYRGQFAQDAQSNGVRGTLSLAF